MFQNRETGVRAPTVSEWIEALQGSSRTQMREVGLTTREISEETGWCEVKVRRHLRALIKQGMVMVARKPITDIGGREYPTPSYRLVLEKKE